MPLYTRNDLSIDSVFLGNYQNAYNHEDGSRLRLVKGYHRGSYRWRTGVANFFKEQHASSQCRRTSRFPPNFTTEIYK